ncbi:MAG: CPBP family intramembrane metalloprotease [Akkermansiaceae bacterium]|nr:CPBP family intramembrane metalloprotease [Akkermansiaceae bacterium]NNM29936.1 CPBP family intramembrane metalloprotease [Akkermansiaceae bacterium]
MEARRGIGWAALGPALVVPFFGALFYFVWFSDTPAGQPAYVATKLFTLVYPLFFLARTGLGGLTRREDRASRWPSWPLVVVTGLGSGVLIAIAGGLLMLTPLGDAVRGGAAAVSGKVEALGFKEHFILFAVFISLIHSALEEYYWRWFLYGHLRRKVGRWAGHGIAAAGFAAHHLIVLLQYFPPWLAIFLTVCVALGGLIWTLVYEWQGTVLGCWLSHLGVDVFLMIIGFQMMAAAG